MAFVHSYSTVQVWRRSGYHDCYSPSTISSELIVEGWKHITNNPFVLNIAAKGHRLRFTSLPLLFQTSIVLQVYPFCFRLYGKYDSGNARANFPNASEECNLRNISRHSRVLFKRIPGTHGIWRVASSYDLKQLNHHIDAQPHFCMHTISSVLSTIERGDYAFKIFQNISLSAVLSCTETSGPQEVPTVGLRKQGIPVSSTSLWSEHCRSGIYSPET